MKLKVVEDAILLVSEKDEFIEALAFTWFSKGTGHPESLEWECYEPFWYSMWHNEQVKELVADFIEGMNHPSRECLAKRLYANSR